MEEKGKENDKKGKRGKWKESGEIVRKRDGEGKKNKFRIRIRNVWEGF